MSWLPFRKIEQTPFHDKAWKRADLAEWDERWARLSVPARKQFLNNVKAGASRQAMNRPFNSLSAIDPDNVQQWRDAGLIRDETKGRANGFIVVDEALGFTARLRALRRYHLLDASVEPGWDNYIAHCFATWTLTEVVDKIVEKHTGLSRYAVAGDVFAMFVKRRRWPEWVAGYLNDPLAAPLITAIENAGGSLPLHRLVEHLPGRSPATVRKTVDQLVNHLVLFEDLHHETMDIMIGLLPAVLSDRQAAKIPARETSLAGVAAAEIGPEGGMWVPDLRAVLLEVAGQPPRLKQDHSLFQKELDRFEAVLDPLPSWFDGSAQGIAPQRLDRALALASHARLTEITTGQGGTRVLALTPVGRRWLNQSLEAQYAQLFALYRSVDAKSHWHSSDDSAFLGSTITAVPVKKDRSGQRRDHSYYKPMTAEERQPLRDAVWRVFNELPVGTFYRVEDFLAHAVVGGRSPVFLDGDPAGVLVRNDSRIVPPLEEHLEEVGRRLLWALLQARLVPFGCVQLGRDARGRLLLARRPRLDVYFGKIEVAEEPPASEETRVVVQPDFSVIVIGLNPAPVAELAPFCERVRGRASQGSLTFRLTRDSVMKGIAGGLAPEQVLIRLQKHSSTPLPKNVETEIRGWCSWVRQVAPAPALLLRCPDTAAADRVMSALGKHAERINETVVAISADGLTSAMRQKLQSQGILLKSE
jgi:hypothetical protein